VSPILIAVGIAILRYRLYEIDLEGDAQRIELAEGHKKPDGVWRSSDGTRRREHARSRLTRARGRI
jgi:hypothetical protein